MTGQLNSYGDAFIPTGDGHGVDISSQRMDALDEESCRLIETLAATQPLVTAIDLGGGLGAHTVRMAQAGAHVTLIDVEDISRPLLQAANCGDRIRFIQKDFSRLTTADCPASVDILYSQRALHYVPYAEALSTLRVVHAAMVPGGRVFISAAGYDTEYGKTHPDRAQPVENRYGLLTPDMQRKHAIHHKIVTYTESEFAGLVRRAGFEVSSVAASDFGNIKLTAFKP